MRTALSLSVLLIIPAVSSAQGQPQADAAKFDAQLRKSAASSVYVKAADDRKVGTALWVINTGVNTALWLQGKITQKEFEENKGLIEAATVWLETGDGLMVTANSSYEDGEAYLANGNNQYDASNYPAAVTSYNKSYTAFDMAAASYSSARIQFSDARSAMEKLAVFLSKKAGNE